MTSERQIYTCLRARQEAANNANVRPIFELSKLPSEIQVIVFAMAAEDNKGLLSLLAVCQEWRNLIIDSPALWRRLEVSRRTTKKTIDFWMSRSKGKISVLIIIEIRRRKALTANVFKWFSNFPDEFWTGLETLEIESSEDLFLAMIDAGMFERLRLRNFCFEKKYGAPRSLTDFTLTTLTSLQIAGDFGNELFAMLDRNPLLTRLCLSRRDWPFRDVDLPKHVELRHLTYLELREFYHPISSLKTFLHIPNLQTLVFRGTRRKLCPLNTCVASVDLSGLPCLRELRVRGCEAWRDELKYIIRATSNITMLEVSPVNSFDTANWLEWLNPPATNVFHCPFLRYMKLSGYQELDLSSLVQFVQGRLQGSSSEGSPEIPPSERPQRIVSVHLENCQYLLHSDNNIKWLKANVPYFTIDSTPE